MSVSLRWWLGSVSLMTGLNGSWMLIAPAAWFVAIPGVADSGPYNEHFVRDVGAAYVGVAVGVALAWRHPAQAFALLVCASVFIGLHGLLHVFDMASGHFSSDHMWMDAPGVLLPAVLLPALAWRSRACAAGRIVR